MSELQEILDRAVLIDHPDGTREWIVQRGKKRTPLLQELESHTTQQIESFTSDVTKMLEKHYELARMEQGKNYAAGIDEAKQVVEKTLAKRNQK